MRCRCACLRLAIRLKAQVCPQSLRLFLMKKMWAYPHAFVTSTAEWTIAVLPCPFYAGYRLRNCLSVPPNNSPWFFSKTNSAEHGPSSEDTGLTASRFLPFREPKYSLPCSLKPAFGLHPKPDEFNPHLSFYFSMFRCNIIIPYTPRSSQRAVYSVFYNHNFV